MKYTKEEHQLLLKLAKDSIVYGLKYNQIMPIDLQHYSANLQVQAACFVTLKINDELKGCIGSLIAHKPLVQDLVNNSYAAAFEDSRFMPLTEEELPLLTIHISILSKSEPMTFNSEQDLIKQLRPGIDGLILSDVGYRGTFLPSVWEELPEPERFLRHLKMKAGLPSNYWSKTIKVDRYNVEDIY
jgi:AmmeMemoRadiSam system protein A